MKKIFTLRPNENWIVDRMASEFERFNSVNVSSVKNADILWCLADWCVDQIPRSALSDKKVVVTVHHIYEPKFHKAERESFARRDEITDVYHVFNERMGNFVSQLTKKPIVQLSYWIDLDFWKRPEYGKQTEVYYVIRQRLGLPRDKFLVASFQRDTEGSGIQQGLYVPKLEKGPDIFCKAVRDLYQSYYNEDCTELEVLLGGWRRQYVTQQLDYANIKYHYIERPDLETVRDMYLASDLYIVGSRCEGGPQAILEAAALGTPIISTPVGIAEQILHPDSINLDLTRAKSGAQYVEYAYNKIVSEFDSKKVLQKYVDFFESV